MSEARDLIGEEMDLRCSGVLSAMKMYLVGGETGDKHNVVSLLKLKYNVPQLLTYTVQC